MLLPLLRRFPAQVRVSLFHTPNLRGLLRRLMPERFNETIGLQHIKVYLFDDSVILSGCVPPPPLPRACRTSRPLASRRPPGPWTPQGYTQRVPIAEGVGGGCAHRGVLLSRKGAAGRL